MAGQKKKVKFAAQTKLRSSRKKNKSAVKHKKVNELFNWNNWGRDPKDSDSDDSDYIPPDEYQTKRSTSRAGVKRGNGTKSSTDSRSSPKKKPRIESRITKLPGSKAHFHDLPPEILEIVFQYALEDNPTSVRRRLMKVCSRWYHELRQPRWWTSLDLEHGWVKNGLNYLKNLHELGFLENLKSLTLCRGMEKNLIPTNYMKWLLDRFPQLEELNVRKAPNLNNEWLEIIDNFNSLTKLDLSYCCPNRSAYLGHFLRTVSRSSKLTSLKLRRFWGKKDQSCVSVSLPTLLKNRGIKTLDLSENSIPSLSNTLGCIPEQIQTLHLDGCWIHPIPIHPPIDQEYRFKNLVEFSANGLEMMKFGTPMLVRILENSSKLKYLGLQSWDVRFLQYMNNLILPELESIVLSRIRSKGESKLLSSKHQVYLPHCERLDELLIDGITADSDFLTHLLDSVVSTKLKRFDAQKSTIEASHIKKILKQNPDLESLDLTNCRELKRGERPLLKSKSEIRSYYKKLNSKTKT